MQISHEAPLCLLEESRTFNDYDYALVHLLNEYPEYLKFFQDSIGMGRRVILDNSLFELGKAFDPALFSEWIEKLKPTDYIIPDVMGNAKATVDSAIDWNKNWNPGLGYSIGVVQGKTAEEAMECYKELEPLCDKIAIAFSNLLYKDISDNLTACEKLTLSRQQLIDELTQKSYFNPDKRHHLLGCSTPQEFKHYINMNWVESVDTSSPILHAIKNIRYDENGLRLKESQKMDSLMKINRGNINDEVLYYNINKFKEFCGRK